MRVPKRVRKAWDMALTDIKIRNAKAKAHRYRMTDSHGLSIEISPASTPSDPKKFWRYRYRLGDKENIFAAGDWCHAPTGETPDAAKVRQHEGRFTLAEARAARLIWRGQVKGGQHPRIVRAAKRLLASQSAATTFKAVAQEFIERRGSTWGDSHRHHFKRFMENDAYPDIGDQPIASLTAAHFLPVLKKVEDRGAHSVAHLGRGYLGQVMRYAVATQKASTDPVALLRGSLVKVETRHHPTLSRDEIGPFLKSVRKTGPNRQTEIAVRLLLLTMLRTIELRTGWWHEIDQGRAEIRLAAERMKMKRPHIVPLPRQGMDLLAELHTITGNSPHLFPNVRDPKKAMGGSTIGRVFVRAGYAGKFTPHGFRGTASTLLREAGFDGRLIELQLAHLDKNKSRAAYDHAELLGPRREMMQFWADQIDEFLIQAV
jgi:integrase